MRAILGTSGLDGLRHCRHQWVNIVLFCSSYGISPVNDWSWTHIYIYIYIYVQQTDLSLTCRHIRSSVTCCLDVFVITYGISMHFLLNRWNYIFMKLSMIVRDILWNASRQVHNIVLLQLIALSCYIHCYFWILSDDSQCIEWLLYLSMYKGSSQYLKLSAKNWLFWIFLQSYFSWKTKIYSDNNHKHVFPYLKKEWVLLNTHNSLVYFQCLSLVFRDSNLACV